MDTTNAEFANTQLANSSQIKYHKILVPHDGSDNSDKALNHAVYLSEISGSDVVLLNVIEPEIVPPSVLLTYIRSNAPLELSKEQLRNSLESGVREMLENRIRKYGEMRDRMSYLIRVGNPVNEIVKVSEQNDIDLVVMASSRITSTIRVIGSTVRKVMNSVKNPILVIHE
jgi:nucleotide-binding universal stress UspA family protein